jgi:two-component system KDP operon response regulator KdpE
MKKILIINDENKFGNKNKRSLKSEGYELLEAKNGMTAYNLLLKTDHVDLILLDINMPEFVGENLFSLLQLFFAQIKVIITGKGCRNKQLKSIDNDVDYYNESERTEVLLEKVKKILGKTQNRAPSPV